MRRAVAHLNDDVETVEGDLAAFIILVAATYVPYTGAHSDVDLGSQNFTTTGDMFANELTLTDDANCVNVLASGTVYANQIAINTPTPFATAKAHIVGANGVVTDSDAHSDDPIVLENNDDCNINSISNPAKWGTFLFSDDVRGVAAFGWNHNTNMFSLFCSDGSTTANQTNQTIFNVHSTGVGIGGPGNGAQTKSSTEVLRLYGTTYDTHWYYGSDEDVYIRPGKATGNVYICDQGNDVYIGNSSTVYVSGSVEVTGDVSCVNITQTGYITGTDYIQFDTTFSDGSAEGRLQWNSDDGTLEVGMPGGNVNLQIGQEIIFRVRNTTGSTINNGDIVRVTGATGNMLLVGLADNTSVYPGNQPMAMATEDIAHNANGYVTVFGAVRDMDTSAWAEGTYLYLGTAGGMTSTVPTAPAAKALVAVVARQHATEGAVVFRWATPFAMHTISDVHAPNGDEDEGEILYWNATNSRYELGNHDSITGRDSLTAHEQYGDLNTGWNPTAFSDVTISVDAGTRTLTVTPTGASAEYWIAGTEYSITSADSVVWGDTDGMWFIYYEGGTLTASQTPWDFGDDKAFTVLLYWNSTDGNIVGWAPELHSWRMNDKLHEYLHETFGCRWSSGLGVAINGDYLDVGTGELYDEDIECNITDDLGSGWFDQTLTNLSAPILWREGTPGVWRIQAASTTPVLLASNIPQINIDTAGTWSLDDVTVNRYFAMWVIASTRSDYPVFLVPGQEDGASLSDARDGNQLADMEFGDLPVAETKVIARVICQRQVGSPYYNLVEVADYRNVVDEPSGTAAVIGDHGNLIGLGDVADHPGYSLIDGTRDFTGVVVGVTPTLDTHLATKGYTDDYADGVMTTHLATYNHDNYDTAYSWGDHDGLYDPVGSASAAVATHESTWDHDLFGVDAIAVTNGDTASMSIGMAAYVSGADTVKRAKADASGTARVAGLMVATTGAAGSGHIKTEGTLTATTGEWDAIAGTTGGLTAGTLYYLSSGTAGYLTSTAPTSVGQFVTEIGEAMSTTKMRISIRRTIGL